MVARWQVLHVEPLAPAKPALGEPCNGCGLCCLAEPCPLGMVLSLRWRGACRMLRWEAAAQRYRCGAIVVSAEGLGSAGEAVGTGAPAHLWARLWNRLARRWIAAGSGCDAALQAQSPPPPKADGAPNSGP